MKNSKERYEKTELNVFYTLYKPLVIKTVNGLLTKVAVRQMKDAPNDVTETNSLLRFF